MSSKPRIAIIAGSAVIVLTGLLWQLGFGAGGPNFTQYPGFAEYFAANPPGSDLPGLQEQELLERHRPRFILPQGHAGLIGFYEDYVAQGELRDGNGALISQSVDRALLNSHKSDMDAVFEHVPSVDAAQHPTIFGRIDRDVLEIGGVRREFTFLTYHAVFRHSGIPAGLTWWQELPVELIGDLEDWHQLDHYTAAALVLDGAMRPVALMVQQHNHLRTYVLGEAYVLPLDGRPVLDVAIRSNEFYAHEPGRRAHRTVRFVDRDTIRFLIGGDSAPWLAGHDITDPHAEADYVLSFLPPDDAFYTFKGALGAERLLPGRSGPPGADYNTLPRFKPLGAQLLMGYWRDGDAGDIARLDEALEEGDWMNAFMRAQASVFAANIGCTAELIEICSYE